MANYTEAAKSTRKEKSEVREVTLNNLPKDMIRLIATMKEELYQAYKSLINESDKYESLAKYPNICKLYAKYIRSKECGHGFIERKMKEGNIYFVGYVTISADVKKNANDIIGKSSKSNDVQNQINNALMDALKKAARKLKILDSTKSLIMMGKDNYKSFAIELNPIMAQKLWEVARPPKAKLKQESAGFYYVESSDKVKSGDMSPTEAKRTMRSLSQSIINDKKNVTQYNMDIYSRIITNNMLSTWADGYNKFTLKLVSKNNAPDVEFKIPSIGKDFVSRFIEGKETINGFLHRSPEIKVLISPMVFNTMKSPDDAYRFFQMLVHYYDTQVEKYSAALMHSVMKLGSKMKHLISNSTLSGLVIFPLLILFSFDNVDMTNKKAFMVSKDDIKTVNKFIRNIASRYRAPEKEKQQIIHDLREMLKSIGNTSNKDAVTEMAHFIDNLQSFYEGKYDAEMESAKQHIIDENVDKEWRTVQTDQVKYLSEKFGVKKLKKIPRDLVAYITIEGESIKDANDKMMIASYCLSKIEIVEWYIELLEVGSSKYIVPHNKQYLTTTRTQLLECYKKIMNTPIPKADRPLFDIDYPKGYEG